MGEYRMVVLTKAVAGQHDELGRWYDTRHIPDLRRVPGLVAAERYSLRRIGGPPQSLEWDYMVVYTIEADDPMTVIAECGRRLGTDEMPRSPALDSSLTLTLVATPEYSA